MKLVSLLPQIKAMLRLPQDKKLLAGLEGVVAKLLNAEKCRDVNCALVEAMRHMEQIQLRADNQSMLMHKYDPEDAKKYEEEKRLEAMIDMSNPALMETLMKKPSLLAGSKRSANVSSEGGPLAVNQRASIIAGNNKANQLQQQHDSGLKSTSSAQPTTTAIRSGRPPLVRPGQQPQQQQQQTVSSNWERGQRSSSPAPGSAYDYQPQKVQCSCYELSERPSYASRSFVPSSASSSYHSQSSIDASSSSQQQQQQQQQQHCSCLNGSNYLRTTNLFGGNKQQQQQHDYGRSPYLSRVSDATNWQQQLDYPSSRSSSFSSGKYAMADLHSHYNPHWAFSSMPEMPLVDDEFMVDAGIRIPSQLATAQASAKIPNLQDIIYRNNRLSGDRMIRRSVTAFPQSSSSGAGSSSSSSSSSRQEPSGDAKSSATGKAFGFGAAKRFSIDYEESTKQSSSAAADQLGLGSNGRSSSTTRYDESARGSKGGSVDARSKSDKARDRRHTVNYTIKLPSPKELSKLKFKRYNEMPEFGSSSSGGSSGHASSAVAGSAGNGRALRRLATLDINHNQGNLSKIPVRSLQGGSRTAPVTRTSSPIRLESDLFAKVIVSSSYGSGGAGGASSSTPSSSSGAAGEAFASSQDRRLRRFRSSDEEVEKLCDKF
ncbi:unnamed protein product [Trichogramma brassicae]|uniref:Uncharacterized protein n=1 Tax=Trichogramma brassicae TaxID=86971 RepID=A0A6H5HYV0_9HYME|nr:unnamed protein product [Trichogramma brassicae]